MSNIGVSKSGPDHAPVGVNPGEVPEPPLGLADRLDELLLRLEVWRERPAVASLFIGVSALVAAVGWWLAQPPGSVPVEHVIPMAASEGSADVGSEGGQPGAEQAGTGQADTGQAGSGQTGSGQAGSGQTGSPQAGSAQTGIEAAEPGGGAEVEVAELYVVHVVGAVKRPGLVQLLPGSRIDDALRAAGGPTDDADIERLNLAAPISDGMQVRLPAHDEEPDEPLILIPAPQAVATDVQAGPTNLNTASEIELQDLPGVGPATAAAIVGWRDDNGGFLTVDDLTQVPGIGPVKLAALRDLVTV